MAAKINTTEQLMSQLASLTAQVSQMQKALANSDARASPKGRGKKTAPAVPKYETVEELTLGSKSDPRAYIEALDDGQAPKCLLHSYSKPIGTPRGSVSDLPAGTVRVSGKYRIPKKGVEIRDADEALEVIRFLARNFDIKKF